MSGQNTLKAIDFFCGAGGMTNGMIQAGIKVVAGIDIDKSCKETYEFNNPTSKFIEADIKELTFEKLIKETNISINDNNLIFIGCSPCQYWTVINTMKSKSSGTKNLLSYFQKFIDHFNPGFIVIENVPGILSNKNESGLENFIDFLKLKDFITEYKIINAKNYGVPQSRKRFLLLATRVSNTIRIPTPDVDKNYTVREYIGEINGFKKVSAGHRDNSTFMHTVAGLSNLNIERLMLTPKNGGMREAWKDNKKLQINAYKDKDNSFKDIYGRMRWDYPSPTITTKFFSLSNGRFGHPDENRAISLREGATLQTFKNDYVFKGKSVATNARLIGNAVPPELSKRIGLTLLNSI